MMKYLLVMFLAGPASAACTTGGSPLNLEIPAIGAVGSEWAACVRRDLLKLSTGTMPVTGSISTAPVFSQVFLDTITARGTWIYLSSPTVIGQGVAKATFTAGGMLQIPAGVTASTGVFASTLTVQGNAFSVGGSSFTIGGGSATVAYRINAGSFAGDGSALTNVSAGTSFSSEDTITSSHPCRVIQSSTTKNIPTMTTTATSLTASGSYIAGSTLTLSGWSGSSYLRVKGRFNFFKNNNNGSGIFGIGVLLDGATLIGPDASTTKPIWSADGNANAVTIPYFGGEGDWVHPTALSAGTHEISLLIMSTNGSDTATFVGGSDAANWFTIEEYSCKN